MEEFMRIKHSFNAGDLIIVLPGLQHIYNQTGKKSIIYQRLDFPAFYYEGAYSSVKDKEGQQVCMNREMFDRLYPLIMSQAYIEDFRIWNGEKVDINIDETRDSRVIPMPAGLLHYYAFTKFPQWCCDLSEPWISICYPDITDQFSEKWGNKIVVNRTHRYTNPYISYHFLKDYQDQILFIGTEEEHQWFNTQFDIQLNHEKVDYFLQLSRILAYCKGGIFNQSMCWHIADALKIPRILELSSHFPNTFPTGSYGYAFYEQKALEYHFNKLINE